MAGVKSGLRVAAVLTLAAGGWFACSSNERPELPEEVVATTQQALDPTWTPGNLQPVAWYVASPQHVILNPDGVSVDRWPDIQNTHDAPSFDNGKPQFSSNGWAPNEGSLHFAGGQMLHVDTWSDTPAGTNTPLTVLAVIKPAAAADGVVQEVVGWWDPNGGGSAWAGIKGADGRTVADMGRLFGASEAQTYSGPHDLGTLPHVVAWQFLPDSQTMKLTVDGTASPPSSAMPPLGSLPQMPLLIGAGNLLPTELFQGDIAELVVLDTVVADTDIETFTEYARNKWDGLPTQGSKDPCVDASGNPIATTLPTKIRCDDNDGTTYGDYCSNGRCAGTVPRPGSPADLKATVWYHAGWAEVSRREAGGIETWFDRGTHHLDLSNGFYFTRPTLSSTDWNHDRPLSFAGHNLMFREGWTDVPDGTDSEFTILAVLQPSGSQSTGVAAWWSLVGAGRVAGDLKVSGSSTVLDFFRTDPSNGTQDFTGLTDVSTGKHVFAWRYSPGQMRLSVDGTTAPPDTGLATLGALNPEMLLVGADSGFANVFLNANVAEVAVIPRSINDAELANYDTYAQTEWGGLSLCSPNCAGKSCGADNGCGGTCDCGACTTSADCPIGYGCAIGTGAGTCGPTTGGSGVTCTNDAGCANGLSCPNGTCTGGGVGATCGVCAAGLTCDNGTCIDCQAPCAVSGCGGADACGGICACGTKNPGDPCVVNADCADGVSCQSGICTPGDVGAHCDLSADCQDPLICYQNTCIADGCLTNPAAFGCGTPDSECANWCTPHPICTSDADCAAGYHCPADNGDAYGVPGLRVCELPACATDPKSLGCGYVLAECGRCRCEPQCQNKHCGDADLSDQCGSTCNGVCQVGDSGCTRDADCQNGVCRAGQCRPMNPCASFNIPADDCGPGNTLCGPCPTADNTRGVWSDTLTRQCGIDPNTLKDLGPCGATEKCNGDGKCAPILDTPPIQVPDAGGSTRDVTPQPSPAAAPIGAIAGTFSVSDRGSATYAIPIEVPPGGSVTPSLVLRYMSTSGNGAMGAGWSLDGLSEIARCPRTFAEDGYVQPVLGTAADAFCMDGHRLEAVTSTENRFEYRTAIDTFTKVVGVGNGDVPDYFMAYTRDGKILTYGQYAASLFFGDASSTAAASWEVSRIEDRMHNFMTIDYYPKTVTDPFTGLGTTSEVVPTQISYTGQNSTQAGDRVIKFNYQTTRDDAITGWRPPYSRSFTRSLLLNSIDVTAAGALVRTYNFNYNVVRNTTLLTSLQECGGLSTCKPATTFEYYDEYGFQDSTVAHVTDGLNPPDPDILKGIGQYGITRRQSGMGTGFSDHISTATVESYITRVSPWFDVAAFAASFIPVDGAVASTILEYSGSKMDKEHNHVIPFDLQISNSAVYTQLPTPCPRDLIPTPVEFQANALSSDHAEVIKYLCPTKTHTGRIVPSGGPAGTPQSVMVSPQIWYTDVNGDGLPDKLSCQWNGKDVPASLNIRFATTTNGVPDPTDSSVGKTITAFGEMCDVMADCYSHTEEICPFAPSFSTLLDVNGDGTDELVVFDHHAFNAGSFAALVFDQNGNGSWNQDLFSDVKIENPDPETYDFVTMDANGDGLRDLVAFAPYDRPNTPAWVLYNTGHGFRQESLTPGPNNNIYAVAMPKFPAFVVDYDHDGRDDYLVATDDNNNAGWEVRHINDDGTVTVGGVHGLTGGPGTIGDFDGDGNLDAWTRASSMPPGEFRLSQGVGRHDHLLKSVTDGVGRNVSIEYDGTYTETSETGLLLQNELLPVKTNPTTGAPTWPTGWPLRISAAGVDHPVVSRHTEGIFRDANSETPDIDRWVDYAYGSWANDVAGYGALGFSSRLVIERDVSGAERRRTYYHYDTSSPTLPTGSYTRPLTGLLIGTVEVLPEENSVAAQYSYQQRIDTTFDWQVATSPSGKPYPYLASKTTTRGILGSYEIQSNDNQPVSVDEINPMLGTRLEQYSIDDYGNVQDTTISGDDLATVYVHRDFTLTDARREAWLISLPNNETIVSAAPNCGDANACDATQRTRNQSFTYYDGTNLLKTIERSPGQPNYDRLTTIERDPVGNPWQIFVTDVATNETRLTQIEYDDRKLFPVSITRYGGQLQQTTQVRYDDRFGTLTSKADPNGIDETWTYDELGRMRAHHGPEKDVTVDYADDPYHVLDSPSVPLYSKYSVTTTRVTPDFAPIPGGDVTVEEFNALGQPVRVQAKGPTDKDISQEFEYDDLHRLSYTYRTHDIGDASQGYESHTYDALDRVTSEADANLKSTTYSYVLNNVISTDYASRGGGVDVVLMQDADGHEKSYCFNAAGMLADVIEGEGEWNDFADIPNGTAYLYGAFNLLQEIQVGIYQPSPWIVEYDDYGRLVASSEPAKGLGTAYNTYDAFDELINRVDHAGRSKDIFYDNYGRLEHAVDGDGGETHWYYDVDDLADGQTDSINRVVKTTSPSGQTVHYSYMGPEVSRNRGFLTRVTHELQAPAVDGSGTETVNLTTDYNYDELSRLSHIDYPVAGSQRFSVQYGYDNSDHVISASNYYNASDVYWQLLTVDQGVSTKERLGGAACGTTFGVSTEGVVTQRTFDQHTGALNEVQTACGTHTLQDISYTHTDAHLTKTLQDTVGGLSGSFGYDALGRISTINNTVEYTYEPLNRGLGSQFGTTYGVQTDDGTYQYNVYWTGSAGENVYHHDSAGDQHERTGPNVQGGSQVIDYTPFDLPKRVTQNGGYVVDFSYDAGGERTVRARDTFSGTPSEVTYYDGDLYQRIEQRGSPTKNRNMIYAGGRLVAIATTTSDDTQDPVIHYLHDDAIGSIQTITSASGTLESTRTFSLFGVEQGGSAIFDEVPYGFTGQEHDDDLGLINMHGRILDPALGEFLTPDPMMANPSGHGLNAFAYVENQPLDWTDPSGFQSAPVEFTDFAGETPDGAQQFWAVIKSSRKSMSYLMPESRGAGSSAVDAADIVSGAGDVAVVVSAGRAAYNFIKHQGKNVQRKPQRISTTAAAPGNSGPGANQHGPNPTQNATESSPSCNPDTGWGCQVAGAADAADSHALQPGVRPLIDSVHPDDSHEVWDGAAHGVAEVAVAVIAPEETVIEAVEEIAEGVRALRAARAAAKAVNLPAWRKVTVNIEHILETHTVEGAAKLSRARPPTVFPSTMSEKGIMNAIRDAYKSSTKIGVQGADRIKLIGEGAGLKIEMWFNRAENLIETAYPVNP